MGSARYRWVARVISKAMSMLWVHDGSPSAWRGMRLRRRKRYMIETMSVDVLTFEYRQT